MKHRNQLQPLTRNNTLVNGWCARRWPPERFAALKLERAWVDPGPSPAGNAGPYLKAPYVYEPDGFTEAEGVVFRLYPRNPRGVPVKRDDGVWCWRYGPE